MKKRIQKKDVRIAVGVGMVATSVWLITGNTGELTGSELNQALELANTGLEMINNALAA